MPPLLAGERRAIECELLHHRAHDALGEILVRLAREQLRAEPGDARVVDARLQIRIWIGLGRMAVLRLTGGERRRLRRAVIRCDEAGRALDAIVQAHD
jgi:hypothetical protein